MTSRRRVAPTRRAALAGLTVVAVLGGGISLMSRGSPADGDATRFDDVYAGLCAAQLSLAAGKSTGAHAVFMERSHPGLHVLAAEVATSDRAAAGDLLEAKAAVESSLSTAGESAASDLGELIESTGRAIRDSTGAIVRRCSK